MNPLRWIRWKIVGVLAAIVLVVYFLGVDTVVLSGINSAGETSSAARWNVQDVALGLLAGNADFRGLVVAPPPRGGAASSGTAAPAAKTEAASGAAPGEAAGPGKEAKVLSAAGAKVDLSMLELLSRRYVVDQVVMDAPQLLIERRADGGTNVGDIGGAPPEEAPPATEEQPRDWVGTARKWYEKIKKVREKLPDRSKKPEDEAGSKAPWKVDYSRGATYPFEGRPTFQVNEIVAQNLQVAFADASRKGEPLPPLENGVLKVTNVSSSPGVQSEATGFDLTGKVAGSDVHVSGEVDLRGETSLFDLTVSLPDMPAALVEAFVGPSLPVNLKSGKISVKADVILDAAKDSIDVKPVLGFKDVTMDPKDPSGKIAGIDAARFTQAFNEVTKEIGQIEITDLRITGSFTAPRFEWGSTVQNLVTSGAKAFASKQAGKLLEEGKERAGEVLDKVPLPDSAGALKDALKKVETKDLEKGLKGILGGGGGTKTE